ncbi:MAG: hypothetical protein JZU53_04915 [Paludibacter sp.]|nr:hypothetical protein [Paludibacter sp.]
MKKIERTVIHLEIADEHYYFGSLAAIYTKYDPEEIGIGYGSLRNYGLSDLKPYKNSKCIIRKGVLKTIEKGVVSKVAFK